MSRRVDALVGVGFTVEQAEMMLRVFDVADERVDSEVVIDVDSTALTNEITVIAPTGLVADPNFGGDRDLAPDVRLFASRNFNWVDTGYEASVGTSAALARPKRAYMTLDRLAFWMTRNTEVLNYDVWHEIQDVRAVCPYSDPANQEAWATWGTGPGGSHAPIQVDGKWYRSNLYGVAGDRLPASSWAQYIDTPDTGQTSIVRMLTVEEFQNLSQP